MNYINNGDDIEIQVTIEEEDGTPIPTTGVNWKIWFYTNMNNVYEASFIDEVATNCVIDQAGLISVFIDGFDWVTKGILRKKVFMSYVSPSFTDGRYDISSIEANTNITIV